jgi:hypothetical protein
MDESYSSTVKSIGAIVLTLVLFLGVGYYVYTSLFVPPGPASEDVVATAPQPSAQTTEKSPS